MKALFVLLALLVSQTTFAQSTCETHSTHMQTSGGFSVGSVEVSNDADNIYINVNADVVNGWSFNNMFIYAGPGPVPQSFGELTPGFFPFQINQTAATNVQYTIPLVNIGMSCGQAVQMAIYTVATDGTNNYTTWAFGPNALANSSYWFEYTPCCPNPDVTGCVYKQGFYKNHNAYSKKSQRIPWLINENTLLCNKRWVDIMTTNAKAGDAWTILAQQWITAKLNQAFGASTGTIVDDSLYNSESILTLNCSIPKNATSLKAVALENAALLENYNNGLMGPPLCVPQ